MEEDHSSSADWSKPVELFFSKGKSAKLKRADQELKKCMGSGNFKERVLKCYSCAWQKEILVHGRLHICLNWICFYSNILGWETKTNIRLKDITAISKQRTALVFPNAILIEVGDKKYGFASFVHRDRTFKVLQLIWHNSQLEEPCSDEALRNQLAHLFDRQLTGKRSSFTGDSSDLETSSILSSNSPNHSPSSSVIPHASDSVHCLPDPLVTSDDDLGNTGCEVHGTTTSEQVDGMLLAMPQHHMRAHSSTNSSEVGSDEGSNSHTSSQSPNLSSHRTLHFHPALDPDPDYSSDLYNCSTNSEASLTNDLNMKPIYRSHSLLNLMPEATPLHPQATVGGSPNFLHHWKRVVSTGALWQTVVTAKPQHLTQFFTPSRLISMLIILFIFLLLLSTVSMVCQLCRVDPALKPYLGWQPWCSCTPWQ